MEHPPQASEAFQNMISNALPEIIKPTRNWDSPEIPAL